MIIDRCRDYEEFKKFFEKYPMHDNYFPPDFVINNPNLICGYNEKTGKLERYCNPYEVDGDLYISGASIRGNLPENVTFIIKICKAYNQDIYADTDVKTARIVLNRAGFKNLSNNLYVRYKNE
jgi:hypothetical protein